MLTAYDSTMASIIDSIGIDIILVGDSAGNVMLGYENTIPVTMDDMIRFTGAVVRSTRKAFIIGDMPFMSYEVSTQDAVKNAGRFIKEGAMAVKLEGGGEMKDNITAILNAGIPVCGHLGLTPQSIHKLGGYKVQARTATDARRLIEDARILEESGVFLLVLECVPHQIAKIVTERISIPTIGIGAGPYCDGQVMVTQDILGLFDGFKPKFVKFFAQLRENIIEALTSYKNEVSEGSFPSFEQSYEMSKEEMDKLLEKTPSYSYFYKQSENLVDSSPEKFANIKNGK